MIWSGEEAARERSEGQGMEWRAVGGRLSGGQSGRTLTSRHFESRWQTGKEGIRRLQAQSHGLYGGQGEYPCPPAAARAPSWARLPDSVRQTVANGS